MILDINKDTYIGLMLNTVKMYSNQIKKAMIKALKTDNRITFDSKKVNSKCKYPILFDSDEEAIESTICDDDFFSFYENWDFEKTYKYSVPLSFDLNLTSGLTFDDFIISLINNKKIISFSESKKFEIQNTISNDIKDCIPYYKKDGNYSLFRFLIKESMINDNLEKIEIRYPIVISVNDEHNFLEIRFDAGRFDLKSQSEYITPKIKSCIKWLKETLCLKLYNINADSIIETIKNDSSKNAVIYKQFMEMKSGGSAELTASEDKGYMLPFIGEIRQLIKDNESIFNESLKSKKLIEDFLDDKEETANYPYIHIKWTNEKKSHEFTVKIIFNYYNKKYIQMHNLQSATRVTKERMEYAIEYLFKTGSFIKGEEI